MKRALRKESITHLLPRIILCGLLAVIMFGLSGKGLISMVVREDSGIETCQEAVDRLDLLLVDEKPRGNSRVLKTLENMKLKPKIHRVDSLCAGFVYAQMGKGIMLLSEVYFQQHRYPGLKAIPIPDEAAVISHELVWNRGTSNPMVARLLDQLPAVMHSQLQKEP